MRRLVISCAALLFSSQALPQGIYDVPIERGRVDAARPAEIPVFGRMTEAARARNTALAFASCTVAHYPRQVRAALAQPLFAESVAAIGKLMSSECLANGDLRMSYISARAALFQAVYREDFGAVQPAMLPSAIALTDPAGLQGDAEAAAFLAQFGDCVARTDTTHSRGAVLAKVGSEAEKEAYAALVPSFAGCMPKGAVIHLNKALVSGCLAEALYREATAARLASKESRN